MTHYGFSNSTLLITKRHNSTLCQAILNLNTSEIKLRISVYWSEFLRVSFQCSASFSSFILFAWVVVFKLEIKDYIIIVNFRYDNECVILLLLIIVIYIIYVIMSVWCAGFYYFLDYLVTRLELNPWWLWEVSLYYLISRICRIFMKIHSILFIVS